MSSSYNVRLNSNGIPDNQAVPFRAVADYFQMGKGIINNGRSIVTYRQFGAVSIPAGTTSVEFLMARPDAGKAWIVTTMVIITGSSSPNVTANSATRIDGSLVNMSASTAGSNSSESNFITLFGAPGLLCTDGIYCTFSNACASAQNGAVGIRYHEVTLS